MPKSQRLRLQDIRSIFHLIGEVRELGHDPPQWRHHMLAELSRMTGAFVGFGCEIPLRGPHTGRTVGQLDAGGFDGRQRKLYYDYEARGDHSDDPSWPGIHELLKASFTYSRERWANDHAWYNSSFFDEIMRPMASDDFLASGFLLPDGLGMHAIRLQRANRDHSFERRAIRVVDLFHQELTRVWHVAARRRAQTATRLPLRQQQVLDLLRRGDSEKEVARRLGLSRHTVHRHIGHLHKRFAVQSRAELLARTSQGPYGFVPKLVMET